MKMWRRRDWGETLALFSHSVVDDILFGSAPMKWFAFNAFGGLVWLAGLLVAKTATVSGGNVFIDSDHHVLTGLSIGAMGLMVLLWTNLRISE